MPGLPSFSRWYSRRPLSWALVLSLLGLLPLGCSRSREDAGARSSPTYTDQPATPARQRYLFAVHPLYNPAKLGQVYQPLLDYLNARLPGAQLELEASRDYAEYEKKLRHRQAEVILPNPLQTLHALGTGYRVIAIAGSPADFRGLFLVRRDSGIHSLQELKGRTLAYPARTALAACILPQWLLHQQGIDVNKDLVNRYVGSQESAIMNACLGEAAAGVTWPLPWRAFQKDHPREAAQLRVLAETPTLISNSVMVRDDLPEAFVTSLRQLLLELDRSPEGRRIQAGMETDRFLPGTAADYEPAREFIGRFAREVRPID